MSGDALLHGAGVYDTDEEFAALAGSFCRDGVEVGDPTLVRVPAEKAALVRDVVAEDAVIFLPHDEQYATAPAALARTVETAATRAPSSGGRLRLLGELPALRGLSRDTWQRYDAAVNVALADHRVFALCTFDTRTTAPEVVDAMLRLHHVVLDDKGRTRPSAGPELPAPLTAGALPAARDPLEDGPPSFELVDPTPATARTGIARLAAAHDVDDVDALLVAVSEVVTNGLLHGVPPVVVRAWATAGRVVVAVADRGHGPHDLLTGLLPTGVGREGGRGLWIVHHLCPEVALSRSADGFTVRLAAGDEPA